MCVNELSLSLSFSVCVCVCVCMVKCCRPVSYVLGESG